MDQRNLTMLMDFYELTMSNGYFQSGKKDTIVYFDLYFRRVPDSGGYAIMAGLEQVVEYIENLSFSEEDIDYLYSRELFSDDFLDYLRNFTFSCDVWAIPEGRIIFPNEPLITVRGPVIQAQLLETMLLLTLNHQCLIATKASRIVRAAQGRTVMEFGSRRAHGPDAANLGARAAYIGGVDGSANTYTDVHLGIPALGTMAHSWVQIHDSEYEAFKTYAEIYPHDCTLLVDTYDVIDSGIPNAIRVFDEIVVPQGYRPKGIRIDSGDLAYLSKKARKMLNEAGYEDCDVVASGGLDEFIIQDLFVQGAQFDSFGVGERLITAKSDPVFGCVYKLVASEEADGSTVPRIKVSENIEKITTPGVKTAWRLISREDGKAIADVITLADETINDNQPYEIFDPNAIWKRKIIENFKAEKLQEPIYEQGRLVYKLPDLESIRARCKKDLESLWEESLRFKSPNKYFVDLSEELWQVRENLILEHRGCAPDA